MPMLADVVDAVIGIDTHRDVHPAEIAYPSGAVIATCSVGNTSVGYAELLQMIECEQPGLVSSRRRRCRARRSAG